LRVAILPECTECAAVWLPDDDDRWVAYLTDDDPPEIGLFCPDCAEREFGEG
jgi:hypothetical protein